MKELLNSIGKLKKGKVRKLVDARLKEFKEAGKKPGDEIFKELCFCLLTANFNAERSIKIQKVMGNGFLTFPRAKLAKELKKLGHRYPNTRADYIMRARKHRAPLKKLISSMSEQDMRDWLVKNVKGLGYKESSHFLRNIGLKNSAIIDFHIIDVLEKHGLIERPMTLTKRKYLEIEETLKGLADKSNLNLAELDLYLWYMETGKVLK